LIQMDLEKTRERNKAEELNASRMSISSLESDLYEFSRDRHGSSWIQQHIPDSSSIIPGKTDDRDEEVRILT